MMKRDISPHFSREEFACKCGCGMDTVDVELVSVLEAIRVYFDCPVTITSGNRCEEYNKKIGGAMTSQHIKSRAADIVVQCAPAKVVQEFLDRYYPSSLGIGYADNFTHIDTRKKKARWTY